MPSKILSLILFILVPIIAYCQNESLEFLEDQPYLDEEKQVDISNLSDQLDVLLEHPIDLNQASKEELEVLPFLSQQQIINFLIYRDQYGEIYSTFELYYIPNWTKEEVALVLPYVGLQSLTNTNKITIRSLRYKHQVLFRYQRVLEQQDAYRSNNPKAYVGTQDRMLARYKYDGKQIGWSWSGKKDAGEAFTRGFDFNSAFIRFDNWKIVKRAILGDYQVNIGQGLVMRKGFRRGYSSENPTDVSGMDIPLKPHSGGSELNYLRGAGLHVQIKSWRLLTWYSSKNLDASAGKLPATYRTIQTAGYHRTEQELANQGRLKENGLGIAPEYRFLNARIGAVLSFSSYSLRHETSGEKDQLLLGMNYNFRKGRFAISGEHALNKKAFAHIQSYLFNIHSRISLALVWSNVSPKYSSRHGQNSFSSNENTIYLGLRLIPIKKVRLSAYTKVQTGILPERENRLKSHASRSLIRLHYESKKQLAFIMQFKYATALKTTKNNGNRVLNYNKNQYQYRIEMIVQVDENIRSKTRVEVIKVFDLVETTGQLFTQDVTCKFLDAKLVLNLRWAYFKTDDFQSRLYAYENDLPLSMSIPAYYGHGSKFYINGRFRINRYQLAFKYALIRYYNKHYIGSGNSRIEGNKRSEIKLQLLVKI